MAATIRESNDRLDISVPLRRYPLAILAPLAPGVVFAGAVAAHMLGFTLARYGNLFVIFDFLRWPGLVLMAAWLASILLSREHITVDARDLQHRYFIGPIPASFATTVPFDQITNLRPLADPGRPLGMGRSFTIFGASGNDGGGTIAFDVGRHHYRLGSSLDEREAQQVIDRIRTFASAHGAAL